MAPAVFLAVCAAVYAFARAKPHHPWCVRMRDRYRAETRG